MYTGVVMLTPTENGRTLTTASWIASKVRDGFHIDVNERYPGIIGINNATKETFYIASGSVESALRLYTLVEGIIEQGE